MSKLKLNPNATFKHVVYIPVAGGEPEPVEFEFKTRGVKAMQDLYARLPEETAFAILSDVVQGWDLDPPAASAIFNAYDAEIYHAREKN